MRLFPPSVSPVHTTSSIDRLTDVVFDWPRLTVALVVLPPEHCSDLRWVSHSPGVFLRKEVAWGTRSLYEQLKRTVLTQRDPLALGVPERFQIVTDRGRFESELDQLN